MTDEPDGVFAQRVVDTVRELGDRAELLRAQGWFEGALATLVHQQDSAPLERGFKILKDIII